MYIVEWVVENRIIVTRAIGDQTKEAIADSIDRLQALMSLGDTPVHVISDSRQLGKYPTDLTLLRKLVSKHEKSGRTVIVGGDDLSRFVSKLLTQFAGSKSPEFRDTISGAVQWLQSIDESLPGDVHYDESSV